MRGEDSTGALLRGVTIDFQTAMGRRNARLLFDQRPRQVEFEMQLGSLQETGRTAGVLPIRVDVPRAGTSHQFVKPLVVDEETVVKLRYKRRS